MGNILIVMQLVPAIIQAMQAVEAALPQAGNGAKKMQAVIDMIVAVESGASSLVPQLQAIIPVLVKLFNDSGMFKKTAPAVPAAA